MKIPEDYYANFVPDLVSVVIPVFNGALTIAETLQSCLAQQYREIEIVVVDDGSTDATADVLSRFGSKVRVISQAKQGIAAARNAGMLAAKGEFIAWLDADDLVLDNRFALQVQVLRQFEKVGLVSSDFSSFIHNGPELDRSQERSHIRNYYSSAAGDRLHEIYPIAKTLRSNDGRNWNVLLGNVYQRIVWGSFVHPPTVMLRRTSLQKSGWCDESLRFPDFDFFISSARHCSFAYIDAPLLRYRHHEHQDSGPRNSAAITVETVRITEKLRQTDPVFYRNNRQALETQLAKTILIAARQLKFTDKWRAVRLIARSVKYKVMPIKIIVALFSALTPAFVRPAVKNLAGALGLLSDSGWRASAGRISRVKLFTRAAWTALAASIALAGVLASSGES